MMSNANTAYVPLLKMPADVDYDTDSPHTGRSIQTATDRSTTSSGTENVFIDSNGIKRKQSDVTGYEEQGKKMRKSLGNRMNQKKPLKMATQNKISAVSRLKAADRPSLIPRPLSPSPSSSSLTSLVTPFGHRSPVECETPSGRRSLILEEATTIFYRVRKSISQMDFKQARRAGAHFPMTESLKRNKGDTNGQMTLVPHVTDAVKHGNQAVLANRFYTSDNYYYMVDQRDPKLAGMKIYATIMLNAWRKRRDDVKRLMDQIAELKRGSIKTKNQVHVCNSLMHVEQNYNKDLTKKLKRMADEIRNSKSSCETLTTSLISIKADKAFLESQIEIKNHEFEGINAILTQTKSELFRSMTSQRELQAALSIEQRKVQALETQKDDLIKEICKINEATQQREKKQSEELKKKINELGVVQAQIKRFETLAEQLKTQEEKLNAYMENDAKLNKQLEELQAEVETLRQRLSATFASRVKECWTIARSHQRLPLEALHWIVFYVLPATPPPRITPLPFVLTIQKAMSIVKR